MTNNRFSAVQLTLLSVIVALVLESLLNQFGDSNSGWHSLLPWLEATAIAILVIAVWSGFALILISSTRQPGSVDFIYPFGLLITLTLATNSLGEATLLRYFCLLAFSGVFACWALAAELKSVADQNAEPGIRRALYIQATAMGLYFLMALVLLVSSPPITVVHVALIIIIALQIAAAFGTMRGWRYVNSSA